MHPEEEILPEDKAVVRLLIRYTCSACDQFYFSEKDLEKCPKGHKYSSSREVGGDVVPTINLRENIKERLEDSFI